jgi:fermentation-respiration switch protein FrsA (DUF1100 family)
MRHWMLACLTLSMTIAVPTAGSTQTTTRLDLRGKSQTLHLYGPKGGTPVVVSSGDGGWVHLGPQVAETLAARGYFVVGFDTKAYLSGFTAGTRTLDAADEPGDYHTLAEYAAQGGSHAKPVLIGVSEGAALSVLAATDPRTRESIAGVIALGLGDRNELGWRWQDAMIYITHGVPDEPTFSVLRVIDQVAPLALAIIQSTHDEFVPLTMAQAIFERAREPKRQWLIDARDHRFSGATPEFNTSVFEALSWITTRK